MVEQSNVLRQKRGWPLIHRISEPLVVTMDPVSASIPLTDISRKKKRPTDLEAQAGKLVCLFNS